MENIFLKILNMSISASWLILVILLLRLIFRRLPKWIMVLLWGIVALRLLLPVSLESNLSLIPNTETIWVTEDGSDTVVQTGIDPLDRVVAPESWQVTHPEQSMDIQEPDKVSTDAGHSEVQVTEQHSSRQVFYILGIIWAVGILALLLYAIISYLRIRRKVKESIPFDSAKDWNAGRIRICDRISTPFILGVFRPVIYLPSGLSEEDTAHVIAHEMAHLKRGDHFWKPLGFLLLMVYWFNPLVWAAYILLCRDIEMACDEKVIASLEEANKKAYANALVTCAAKQREITVCPLAFGEVGVKERVKGILNYKRPAFWVLILSVVACVVIAVCFLTNPAKEGQDNANGKDNNSRKESLEGAYYYTGNKIEQVGTDIRRIDLMLILGDNGSFYINETPDGDAITGDYELKDDILICRGEYVTGNDKGKEMVFHFRTDDGKMCYVSEESSGFRTVDLEDGEVFQKGQNPYEAYIERCYYYQANGQMDDDDNMIYFYINLLPNGICEWYESPTSSYVGEDYYSVEGDILTIRGVMPGTGEERTNRFRINGNEMVFIEEGSSNFNMIKLVDGERFSRGPDLNSEEEIQMKASYLEEVTKQWESRRIAAEEELRAAQEAAEQMKMEAEEAEKRAQDARRALEEIDKNQGKTSDEKVFHTVVLNDQSVSVKYGTSKLYSMEDRENAVNEILAIFSDRMVDGVSLYEIRYTSDEESSNPDELRMLNESARAKTGNPKLTYKEYMKFESDSREPEDPSKSSDPGAAHAGWGWWFAREEGGEWTLVGQGY